MALSAQLAAEFEELCSHYPEKRAGLIPALHRCRPMRKTGSAPMAHSRLT